jgi:phytoene desaturase
MHESNRKFFKDDRLIQMFDRYATYNGSNPYLAPATLNLISYVENSLGGYYLTKGMYELTDALYKLASKKGVEFNFEEEIISVESGDNKILSMKSNRNKYTFNYYISNLDALTANTRFFDLPKTKIDDNLLSTSAMVFYWGVNGVFPELDTHNIIFAQDYKREFDNLFQRKIISDDVTIYIYVSSKFNKNDAPPNCENWFVMINTPANFGQNWEEEINKTRETIINKIESRLNIRIRDKIISERTLTPDVLESKTGSFKGSIYGFSSNTKFSAFKRQSNRSKKYKNLFYCGGSAHPGGGIPLVILSGKNVCELIGNRQ